MLSIIFFYFDNNNSIICFSEASFELQMETIVAMLMIFVQTSQVSKFPKSEIFAGDYAKG